MENGEYFNIISCQIRLQRYKMGMDDLAKDWSTVHSTFAEDLVHVVKKWGEYFDRAAENILRKDREARPLSRIGRTRWRF